jgi:hypothetical protein
VGGQDSWTGTGFVHAVDTDRGSAAFLVTNKHVLDGADELTVAMMAGDDGRPAMGSVNRVTIGGFGPDAWRGHPDAAVDVAVMPLSAVLAEMVKINPGPGGSFYRSVPVEMMLTDAAAGELDAIEEIFFIGYPSGIYDRANFLPVARRGTTATPVAVDYEGHPAFLVDGSVFPGSSGSPVFLFDRGIRLPKAGGDIVIGGPARNLCLGVLAAVHTRSVEGEVSELPAARLTVSFDEPIDLGIVYKASAISDCVDLLLAAAGLARRPAAAAPTAEATEADAVLKEQAGAAILQSGVENTGDEERGTRG